MGPCWSAAVLALGVLVAGCRLVDVIDHQERAWTCRQGVADGTPCTVNGDVVDRGAGVERSEGVCASGTCWELPRGSQLAEAEAGAGKVRLAVDAGAALAIAALVLVLARWSARRKRPARLAYELPPDPGATAPAPPSPPSPARRRAFVAAALAIAFLPGAGILARYPRRAILSARTPRAPGGAGFHADNRCHDAEVVERDGKVFLVTNVASAADALGPLGYLVAYDLASGEPRVLAGPSRPYDHTLPILFVRAGDDLVTADRDGEVRVLEAGTFREKGRAALAKAPRWIQAAPGGRREVWVGENTSFGYVDLDHLESDDRRSRGWQARSLECWSRKHELCPQGTPGPEGLQWPRDWLFAEGCLTSAERGAEAIVVERRAQTAPFAVVWRVEQERAPGASRDLTVAGEHFYGVERAGGRAVLVQRALADGDVRWSVPLDHRLASEPPFRAGPWLVVPTYPVEGRYEKVYEIRDAASGALARVVP